MFKEPRGFDLLAQIEKEDMEREWADEGPIRECCGEAYNSDETGCVYCGKDMTPEGVRSTKCVYPDWEGGFHIGKHTWDKKGWCCVCGEKKPTDAEGGIDVTSTEEE